MRCPSCGFENAEELKFCNECGSALKRRCVQCGCENAPQAKFCGECGTPLTSKARDKRAPEPQGKRQKGSREAGGHRGAASPILYTPKHLAERIRVEQAALEARDTADGERKTITTLFADL